jgi:hypothetical protein
MEGWPYTAYLGDSDPAGVMCTVMDRPYRLPCRNVPGVLTGAAQLRADGISSKCTQPSVMTTGGTATKHSITFMSLNVASLNVIVPEGKSFKM